MKKILLVCAAGMILASVVWAQAGFTAVSALLGTHCGICHQWTTSYKGIADPSRVVASSPEKSLLYQVVSTDMMPRSGVKLSADEKALMRAWIAAGALPNDSPPYPAATGQPTAPVPEPCPCGLK